MNDFDKGYKAGYNKAYSEIYEHIRKKMDINPIDQMYGRYPYVYPDGATGVPIEHTIGYQGNGPTGPIGYMP